MAGTMPAARFVGRTAELDQLRAAYEAARSGDPVTLVVGGEAGVGKTRMVTQFGAQVREGGGRVLLGGCIDVGDGSLPYAPVVQALRGLVQSLDGEALNDLVGSGRSLLGRLLPELVAGDEWTETPPGAQGSSSQARLFETFLGLFERLADRSPIVLVVEDLHWADRSTLDLLTFLIRNFRAGMLTVLTYRSDDLHRRHPLRPFLAELDRSKRVDRLPVDRFDREEIASLVAGLLGARPHDDLVDRVYRRSGGNAFFAEELVAVLADGDGAGLPPSLENVLLSRVHVLSEDAQAALRVIAAAGGPVEHAVLAAVTELSEPALLAALRDAVAHQVLLADPDTETYAFRHALSQEALYGDLLPGERARLHAAFARALSDQPHLTSARHGTPAARLAYHWVRAHEPAQALRAAVAAGLESEAAYGFADAQRHFETALELWDQVPEPDVQLPVDRVGLLRHAAVSAYLAGDPTRAITLTRAALAALGDQDPPRAGLLHALLGAYLHATGGQGATAEYDAALRLVPTHPLRVERAQVLADFAEALIGQGRYVESRRLSEEAIAIATELGTPAVEADARRAFGVDLAFLGDLRSGVAELEKARQLALSVGKVEAEARTFATLSGLLDSFGELEYAAATALEGAERTANYGLGQWHSPFLTATAGRAVFGLGRWREAEALFGHAAEHVAPQLAAARVFICSAQALLEVSRGQGMSAAEHLSAAREAYAQTVRQTWFAAPLFEATAELALLEGRLADVQAAVSEGLRIVGGSVIFGAPLYVLGIRAAADRAELARARRSTDEVDEACRVGAALGQELRDRISGRGTEEALPTPRTRAQGRLGEAELARLSGHTDPDLWAGVAETWQSLEEPYRCAYAHWREAEAVLLAGMARDRAVAALRTANATAVRLGAVPLSTEVEALARRARLDAAPVSGRKTSAPSEPSPLGQLGLTRREEEVLTLIATGRTNRQIAETLFISPKTATLHVSNILGKLGVSNRVEAATIAHRLTSAAHSV